MKRPYMLLNMAGGLALAMLLAVMPTADAQMLTISAEPGERLSVPLDEPSNPAAVLWQQDISVNSQAYIAQVFPDQTTMSSFVSDDFNNTTPWTIDAIYIAGEGTNGFSSFDNATSLNWEIYADDNGTPDGDPLGGGNAPVWSLSLSPDDPRITVTNGTFGLPSNTRLDLDTPVSLPAGDWWLIFHPEMPLTPGGQYFWHISDTMNGNAAMFINPGGGFGYGTEWQPMAVIAGSDYDLAFTLEGTAGPTCGLTIKYKEVRSEKLFKRPLKRKLTITGGEGFDIFGEIDLGVIAWRKVKFNPKKNRLKIRAIFPFGLEPGIYPIWIGDCYGEVEVTGFVPPIP